jgi:hypothetical protein
MMGEEFKIIDEKPFLRRQLIRNILDSEIDRANAEYFIGQINDNQEMSIMANSKVITLLSTKNWFEKLTKEFDKK